MPAIGARPPVLQTKLYRPPLTEDFVPRLRLRERLKQIVQRPLTLVSAPAGYGKSTLLSAWLEHCQCRSAWLSLDENDNDLGAFASYFLAAMRDAIPSFGGALLLGVLDGASLPPARTFVEMVWDELGRLGEDVVLVLDDYGAITNNAVHELITELLRHPHPRLHLVLSTRHDPPLPLNEWRAHNQLVEIRAVELRFSQEETGSFLKRSMDGYLDDETVASLNEKTEGWIAGLRLAALSVSHVEELHGRIDELSGSNMYIRDYLVSQVLAHLPAETQSFLVQSSILDRLSAPLCQAVVETETTIAAAQKTLQELEADNVFIILLDDLRQWYRYHHLFQQFLQMRLAQEYSAAFVAGLHERASAWFAEHGYIEEALQHALAAGDTETAVGLVAANRQALMNEERFQRLSRWLQKFPRQIIDESPDLLLLQARFAQVQRYDMVEMSEIVDKVDTLVNRLDLESERTRRLLAENNALRSARHYFALDPQTALDCSRDALAVLPQEWYALRSYCYIYGAVALQMMGDLGEAYEWIDRGRREDLLVYDGPQARNAAAEGFVCWMAADLAGLQRVGEFMLGVVRDASRWQSHGWAHYFLACAYYHRNDLDNALFHAQETFHRRYINHALASVFSALIMALIHQARGKPDEANETLALASDYAVEIRSSTFILMVQSFRAELAVLQGRARDVTQWAEQAGAHLQLAALPFFYAPQLTVPKVLLAGGTPHGRALVADCLQRLHDLAASTHNTRVLIEVLALEALLHAANEDEEAALAALEESLALAQPAGFIRLYVDLGPRFADLLRRGQNREPHARYITAILGAFAPARPPDPRPSGNGQLVEPLTGRELEILQLLAGRYSNKEIAAELVISPATVKRHTISIYQKLAVHKRREAVEAASALGLIPPS